MESLLPSCRHFGRLDGVNRKTFDQGDSFIGSRKRFLIADCITALDQRFNDCISRCRRTDSGDARICEDLLQLFIREIFTRGNHSRKQSLVGIPFRRLGFLLLFRIGAGNNVAFMECRKDGFLISADYGHEPGINDRASARSEGFTINVGCNGCSVEDGVAVQHADNASGDQIIYLFLLIRQVLRDIAGRNDGEMAFDFLIIEILLLIKLSCSAVDQLCIIRNSLQAVKNLIDDRFHIFGKIAGICTGIGCVSTIVKGLCCIERFLQSHAESRVCVHLESRQTVKLRNIFIRAFFNDVRNGSVMSGDFGKDRIGVSLFIETLRRVSSVELLPRLRDEFRFDRPEFLRLEVADCKLAIDKHLERRRLHASDAEDLPFAVVLERHSNSEVSACYPICDTAHAACSFDVFHLASVFQGFEGVTNAVFRLGGKAGSFNGALAVCKFVDISEDNFALTIEVRCVDNVIALVDQRLHKRELLFDFCIVSGFIIRDAVYDQLVIIGNERERHRTPVRVRRIVILCLFKLAKMSEPPGNIAFLSIKADLKEAVFRLLGLYGLFIGFQLFKRNFLSGRKGDAVKCGGNFITDVRLFCNNCDHLITSGLRVFRFV